MSQINLTITLDNIDGNIDAHQIASTIESTITQICGMEVQTNIYDNDGSKNSNPIFMRNMMRKIR